MSSSFDFDYAVVGAGINGTWTAFHLVDRGFKTVLIEQFPLPHTRGSSHGHTRIIRRAYPEPHVRAMMDDAYEQWDRLEKETNTKIIHKVGMLAFGKSSRPWISGTVATFKASGGSFKTFSDKNEIMAGFPELDLKNQEGKEDFIGLVDEEGGFMMAEKALEATRHCAMQRGCKIRDAFPVRGIRSLDEKVQVEGLDGSVISAKGLAICAGAWTNKLLQPLGLKLPLYPMVVPSMYWLKKTDSIPKSCVIYDCPPRTDPGSCGQGQVSPVNHICLLPEHDYPGMVKVYSHQGIYLDDPDLRDSVDVSQAVEDVRKFLKDTVPGVESDPAIVEKCLYTMSPDHQQILDWHPRYKNVVIGAGFSGSGFKIAPVTGETLAEMLIHGRSLKHPQHQFSAKRFD